MSPVANAYDQAHMLAQSLKASPEYANYRLTAARLGAEKQSLDMLRDFRRRQIELQSRIIKGEELSAEEQERFAQLSEIVSGHVIIGEFMRAEYNLTRLLADIEKIIAEAIEVGIEEPKTDVADEPQ